MIPKAYENKALFEKSTLNIEKMEKDIILRKRFRL